MGFFRTRRERRKRRRLQREIIESLTRIRDAAVEGARELQICGAALRALDEQLEAAVAVNDEASAREIMARMAPLVDEHPRLVSREKVREELIRKSYRIEETT